MCHLSPMYFDQILVLINFSDIIHFVFIKFDLKGNLQEKLTTFL